MEQTGLDRVIQRLQTDEGCQRMNQAVGLVGQALDNIPLPNWDETFPNDFASMTCFVRTYRELCASIQLLTFGYYDEVRVLLRAVYENAGAGRMLAKEPELAEQWLQHAQWWPDRQVRDWIKAAHSLTDTDVLDYSRMYGLMSKWAHPTAHAALPLIEVNGQRPVPGLIAEYDDDLFTLRTKEISLTAIFAGFALRNATVSEQALHPTWRREFLTLASALIGTDLPGLDTDWDREEQRFDELQTRIQAAADLNERLRSSPSSWDNLNTELD